MADYYKICLQGLLLQEYYYFIVQSDFVCMCGIFFFPNSKNKSKTEKGYVCETKVEKHLDKDNTSCYIGISINRVSASKNILATPQPPYSTSSSQKLKNTSRNNILRYSKALKKL